MQKAGREGGDVVVAQWWAGGHWAVWVQGVGEGGRQRQGAEEEGHGG